MIHHIQQPGCAVIDRHGIVQWTFSVPPARKLTGKRLWGRQAAAEQDVIAEAVEIAWTTGLPQSVRTDDDPESLFRLCELNFAPLGDSWLTVHWRLLVDGLLTARQLQVLRLTCAGLKATAAAAELLVSYASVWDVKLALWSKTGTRGDTGLLAWAITRGLWRPEDSFRPWFSDDAEIVTSTEREEIGGAA